MERLEETVLSRETLFEGSILALQRWFVLLPNGKCAPREVVVHKGAAAVVPVDGEGRVAVVRQYRAPMGNVLLEIPAGKLDSAGEDPLCCAKRELREETGLTAEHWRLLTTIATTPGFATEKIALYLATGLKKGQEAPDEDEFLSVSWMPLSELCRQIREGLVPDAKTCVAALLAEAALVASPNA